MEIPEYNIQLVTKYSEKDESKLVTKLEKRRIKDLKTGEILVRVLYVPLHGSFWLATHPFGIHPRHNEFMRNGCFVFGNGGVGEVVAVADKSTGVECGDYVCILGHSPCRNYDCYGCCVLHRYTECEYNENNIIGHGKGANDGTLALYATLPRYSWELCFKKGTWPMESDLKSFMFGFLIADVRNALTRHPDSLRMRRMLLFGAGNSGHIAAYLHLHTCPEAKILVVDPNSSRLESIKSLNPKAIDIYELPEKVVGFLNSRQSYLECEQDVEVVIKEIEIKMKNHFRGRKCNLLFDGSSGNAASLWDNENILSPTAHCIPFGFGSDTINVGKKLIQYSGLSILMSRGVGNLRNRREVIELIKDGASDFINEYLIGDAKHLKSLEDCERFVQINHNPPKLLNEIQHAYVTPNQVYRDNVIAIKEINGILTEDSLVDMPAGQRI